MMIHGILNQAEATALVDRPVIEPERGSVIKDSFYRLHKPPTIIWDMIMPQEGHATSIVM
jgi:hypothetical protein